MKKIIYTFTFVAFTVSVSLAQAIQVAEQKTVTKDQVNPDGTLKQEPKKDSSTVTKKQDDKSGTRMAITEKGVPTSKPKTTAKTAGTPTKTPENAKESGEKK